MCRAKKALPKLCTSSSPPSGESGERKRNFRILRQRRSNRHRQAVPTFCKFTESCAFCLASVATKQNLFRCSVFPRSQKAVTPILYTACGGLSRNFKKGVDFSRFCAIIKVRGNTGDGHFLPKWLDNRVRGQAWAVIFFYAARCIPAKGSGLTKEPPTSHAGST